MTNNTTLSREQAIEILWKLYKEEIPKYAELEVCVLALDYHYYYYDYDYDYYYEYRHTIICLILAAEGEL